METFVLRLVALGSFYFFFKVHFTFVLVQNVAVVVCVDYVD